MDIRVVHGKLMNEHRMISNEISDIKVSNFELTKEQRKLQFIGYKKPHPLEKKIMFSIQGQNDNLDELINDIIKVGCNEIIKMLNKIQNELEGTSQFVNELKMIS